MRFSSILSIFFISIIIFNINEINAIEIDLNIEVDSSQSKEKKSSDIKKKFKENNSDKVTNDPETVYFIPNNKEKKQQFNIDGKLNFFYSYSNQDYKASSFAPQMIETDNRLNFRYKKTLDEKNNFFSDIEIKKKFNNNPRLRGTIGIDNKTYGILQLANFNDLTSLIVSSYDVMVGSGSGWYRNLNTNFNYPSNIVNSPIIDFDTVISFYADSDLASVMYFSPDFNGLKFGASYTADTFFDTPDILRAFPYKNVLSLGAQYSKEISKDVKMKLSAYSELGQSYYEAINPNAKSEDRFSDLRSFFLSGLIETKKFAFVLLYGDYGNSNTRDILPVLNSEPVKYVRPKDSYFWDGAMSYKFGDKTKASIRYTYATTGQDYAAVAPAAGIGAQVPSTDGKTGSIIFHNIALAINYKMFGDYLIPYIELDKFKLSDNDAVIQSDRKKPNNGFVVVLGARSNF